MPVTILKYLLITPAVLLCFCSCREEIIPPFTPEGNVNEPVQEITADSYSFTINAQSISDSLIDHIFFKYSRSNLNLSLFDYFSGAAELTIYERGGNVIYKSTLDKNLHQPSLALEGYVPNMVQIFFKKFTGKLSIQIIQ